MSMETFRGKIDTTNDALLLFEACRLGRLKRVPRRLSESERLTHVKAGAIFIWDEDESGIKRWTDGKSWSPSRIHGSFLLYKEIEPRRKPPVKSNKGEGEAVANDFVVKEGGLIKKALSICTADSRRQHLVSYYSKDDSSDLKTPSSLPSFAEIAIPNEMYPEFVPDGRDGLMPAPHLHPDHRLAPPPQHVHPVVDLYGRPLPQAPYGPRPPMLPFPYPMPGMMYNQPPHAGFPDPSAWMPRPAGSGLYDGAAAYFGHGLAPHGAPPPFEGIQQRYDSYVAQTAAAAYPGYYPLEAPRPPMTGGGGFYGSGTTSAPAGVGLASLSGGSAAQEGLGGSGLEAQKLGVPGDFGSGQPNAPGSYSPFQQFQTPPQQPLPPPPQQRHHQQDQPREQLQHQEEQDEKPVSGQTPGVSGPKGTQKDESNDAQ